MPRMAVRLFVPGRPARGGLTWFAPPAITSRRRGAIARHPGYSRHRRPAAPARNGTAASAGVLRGDHRDDLAVSDQVPVPVTPYPFKVTRIMRSLPCRRRPG